VKTFFIDLHNLLFSNQFVTAFIVYKSYWDKKLDDFFVGLVNKNKFLKLCKEKKKTKLDKKFKANINIDVEVPPIIKSNKVSLDDINKYARKVAKCLFVFQTILEHENVDLNIFYNNLKSLKINQSNFIQKILNKINKRSGWYSPDDNEINYVDRLEAKDTIFHELLHAASSIEDKEESISFSGFEQINCERWQKIGRALNEGYTELLNQRYFSPVRDVYTMEVTIAKMIERIVGREKMTEMYFQANLKGLINELSKYNENILEFLGHLDFLSTYMRIKDKSIAVKEKLQESCEYIVKFIIESYQNYIKISGLEPIVGEQVVISEFIEDFKCSIYDYGTKTESLDYLYDKEQQVDSISNIESSYIALKNIY